MMNQSSSHMHYRKLFMDVLRLAKVSVMLFITRAGTKFHYQFLKIARINFLVI